MSLEKELEKDLESELETELEGELSGELEAELSGPAPQPDPEDVPRTEEGFNLLSPVGLMGAAASKVFGFENVEAAVNSGTEILTGAMAGAAKQGAIPTLSGVMAAGNQAIEDGLNPNTDVSIEGMYNAYADSRKEMEDALDAAVDKAPISGTIGSAASMLGLMRAFKIPTVATKANMAEMAKFNFLHGYATANDEDNRIVEGMWQSSLGVAFDAMGIATYNKWLAIKKSISNRLGEVVDETTLDILTPKESGKAVTSMKNYIKRAYNGDTHKAARDAHKILDIDNAVDVDDMYKAAQTNKADIGQQITAMVDSAEEIFEAGSQQAIDGNLIGADLKRAMGSVSTKAMQEYKYLTPALQKAWGSVDELIDDIVVETTKPVKTIVKSVQSFKEVADPQTGGKLKIPVVLQLPEQTGGEKVFKQFTPKSLHMTKTKLAQSIDAFFEKQLRGNKLTESQIKTLTKDKAKIVGSFVEVLDETMSNLSKGDASGIFTSDKFRQLNSQYGLATKLEELAATASESKFRNSAFKLGSTAMTFKGFFLTGMGGMAGGAPGIAAGVFLNSILQSSKTPAKVVRGLNKLRNKVMQQPNGDIARRLAALIHASDSPEAFEENITAMASEVNLIENAVARDIGDVVSKANSISALIRVEMGDEAADSFLEAINSGDTDVIGSIMEQFEDSNPKSRKFIKDGKGWDGKVYSEAKKAELMEELETYDISRKQKLELGKSLREHGLVPQINQEPDRFFNYKQRDKSKPNY